MGNHIDLDATSAKWGLLACHDIEPHSSRPAGVGPAILMLAGCSSTGQVSLSKPETLFGLLEPYRSTWCRQCGHAGIHLPDSARLWAHAGSRILGTPMLTDVFHNDRWDYVFTIRRQGVPDQKRRVTVYFKNDAVDHFDSETLPLEREFVASIDKPREGRQAEPNPERRANRSLACAGQEWHRSS